MQIKLLKSNKFKLETSSFNKMQNSISNEVKNVRTVGFIIPVVDGKIWLGKRGTEPYKGLYGGIGGKSEAATEQSYTNVALIEKPGGHKTIYIADRIALSIGKEFTSDTAVRETFEEIYSNKKYPEDMDKNNFSKLRRIGVVYDILDNFENKLYFFLSELNQKDFSLSPREIHDFKPLEQILESEIIPTTKLALIHLKYMLELGDFEEYKEYNLKTQIPEINITEFKFTSLLGAIAYYSERNILPD